MKNTSDDSLMQNKLQYQRLWTISCLESSKMQVLRKSRVVSSVPQKQVSSSVHKNELKTDVLFKPKLPKSFYVMKLREWAEEIPTVGLLSEWKNNILLLIYDRWNQRYLHIQQKLFEEVETMFINDMQQLAIQSIVVNYDEGLDNNEDDSYINCRYSTKVVLYKSRYQKYRNCLRNKYFMSHYLMRRIISLAISELIPDVIIDFSYYHTIGLVKLAELKNIMKKDLQKGSSRVNHKYYGEVTKLISDIKSLQEIPHKIMPQFMQCATNLIMQQILFIAMHTITHMISVIKSNKKCPQIEFELIFENESLIIKPSMEEMKNMYYDIIFNIEKIWQNFSSLKLCSRNYSVHANIDDSVCAKLPNWFIRKSISELEISVNNFLQPLNDYYHNIYDKFKIICSNETWESVINFVEGDHSYDMYYEQVKKFNIYLKRANKLASFSNYDAGRLSQISAKTALKTYISNIVDILVTKLVSYHVEYNQYIWHKFEIFRSEALNIPKNAEALFKMNDNMALNSKAIIDNLENEINKSIEMLITLLDITSLTNEHIELNRRTINCLSCVDCIFFQNNTLCEAMKSELEDELQKKINVLNIHVDNMFPELLILNDMDDVNRVDEYIGNLNILVANIAEVTNQIQAINLEEKLFKFPETLFPKVNDIRNILSPFFHLINVIYKWGRHNSAWLDGPFEYIDAAVVEKLVHFYLDEITNLNKSIKANIKSIISSHKSFKFSGMIDDPDPMQQPAPMKLCFQALEQINKFKQYVPLIKCVCNNALERRHWTEISSTYGYDITPNAGTTLRKFIALNLMDDIDKYHVISVSANKELALQRQLESMYGMWEGIKFDMKYDEMSKLTFANFDVIQSNLEEHLTIIQEMKGSYFVKPFANDVDVYNNSLILVRDVINQYIIIQDECIFLRPIFASNRIATEELKDIAMMYLQVEKIVDEVTESISHNLTFHNIGRSPEYSIKLLKAMKKIEIINSAIRAYLNNIRLSFPRLFFLSDKELMMVLCKKNAIKKMKDLLKKCFQGIKNLKVSSSEMDIISIVSNHNEELMLKVNYSLNDEDTDDWLKIVQVGINEAIRENICNCITNINAIINKQIFFLKSCSLGIIAECMIQLTWTSNIQKCFMEILPEKFDSLLTMQNSLIDTAINDLRNQLMMKERIVLMCLTTVLFNQREIINLLILKNVSDDKDFDWIAQLRYYWQENDVKVEMIYDSRHYGYEFSTTTEPIVQTLLTDRCYRTIIEAHRYNMFASLTGHTDTGKTETIKGLTRALAVPFQIINCCVNLSCEQIIKIFKGLITCGAWVCFKNINATKLTVLSAVTHHIHLISQIVSSKSMVILFEGSQLILKSGGFLITTINDYRSTLISAKIQLPDNFRALFRLVAFRRPDISKICEARFFATGFRNAKILASKIALVYKLSVEQFSFGKQYDFGCRTLTAVIRSAINLKSEYLKDNEYVIILRALIDVHLPMFSHNDTIVFQQFLNDIFPGVYLPSANYTPILKALEQLTNTNGIQAHTEFTLKIIQVLEMIHLRRIIMLIGDTLSGKTTLLRTLVKCLSSLVSKIYGSNTNTRTTIQLEIINQKSMTLETLFGYLNIETHKWNDGIFTTLLRDYNKTDKLNNLKKWIIFDGPVESKLMEYLNILVDLNDTKTLPLPSGETIEMLDTVSVILETDNIEEASPSIVSRCGIIYIEQKAVGYKHYIASWVIQQKNEHRYDEFLTNLIEWSLDSCLDFVYKKCQFQIIVEKLYLVMSALKLCSLYIRNAVENAGEKDKNHLEIWYQAAVLQSIIWSFSACLSINSCTVLNEFCVLLWCNNDINNPRPNDLIKYEMLLPCEGMIQDNTFIFKGTGFWKHWSEILKTVSVTGQTYGFEFPFVPTIDTVKHLFMFQNHIKYRTPFIVCGDISTGKTTLMRFFLDKKISKNEYMTSYFNFSSISAAHQDSFLFKLNRIMSNSYAPLRNKFGINFIDDLNSIISNDNSQPNSLLELLRQYIDHGHWYDSSKLVKVFINNIMFLCALELNGHAQSKLHSRFMSHFNLYSLSIPSRENAVKIFSNNLLYNLKKNLFTPDVFGSIKSMINATIDIYNSIIDHLKSIPMNFHHQFNFRDITKVINGCSLIHRESTEAKVTLIRLWVHESIRVFGDRISNEDDNVRLFSNIKAAVETHFRESFESVFDHLPKDNNELSHKSLKNLMFSNFMGIDKDLNNRRYEEVGSTQLLKNKIIYYLDELNNSGREKLDILLLSDMFEHLIRICRILCIPGGNLLMVCLGGSGRKSLIRLAAYIERQDFFQCTSNHYCNFDEWHKTLKCVVRICGGGDNGVSKQCTLFLPTRFIENAHYEDITSLMATGEILNLISLNERQAIVEAVRLFAQKGDRNLEISINDVMDYFFNQCREKLHFILYVDALDSNSFRRHLQLFPALSKYSHIDYFTSWPLDTYLQLGNKFLRNKSLDDITKDKIIIAGKYFYDKSKELSIKYYNNFGRLTYATPSAFIHMMRLYNLSITKGQQKMTSSRNKYLNGLKKLEYAAEEVTQMQGKLTALRPQLELSARKTEETMGEIESENVSVENATIQVKRDEEIANKTAKIAALLKSECEAELAVAIPILEDAVAALNTLKPSDITLVKAMKNPPDTVKLVMAAVCVMLDIAPERIIDPVTGRKSTDFWGPSKRVLGDMNFLQNLKDYDKDNIPLALMQVIKKTYMTDKNFMPHIVTKASSAAEGLCKWVRAMVSYDEVAKIVAPKKKKLLAAEKECNECLAFLNEKRKTLADLNDKLATLKSDLQATLAKKFRLENEVKTCMQKLVKAEALITSLDDEKTKWLHSSDQLKKSYDNLVGDILISSGIISYLAPYNSVYRNDTIILWLDYMKNHLEIVCSNNYNFVTCLESEIKIISWHQCELPNDDFFHENAVIFDKSMKPCLFIDPESQANKWIKKTEQNNELIILKLTDTNYLQRILNGIKLNKPVLVENIGDNKMVTLSIDCILSKIIDNHHDSDRCNDQYSYASKFRLYITTNLDNPFFDRYIFSKMTIINFSITEQALQSKLLDIVVSRERPELHEKFDLLVNHSALNMQLLKQEEDNILSILSASTINILQDDESMKILDASKNMSVKIIMKEKSISIAKTKIDIFRDSYLEFSHYCAAMYSTLLPLSNLNCMYKFSLEWFMQLYTRSIMNSKRSIIILRRLKYLISSFTEMLHSSISSALFDKHRLLYSLILCLKILTHTQQVKLDEIDFFMSDHSNDIIECIDTKDMKPHWLPEKSWKEITLLSQRMSVFYGLKKSIKDEESLWLDFYKLNNPDNNSFPKRWQKLLTPFQKLIIFKIIRPDRTVIEIDHFIHNTDKSLHIRSLKSLFQFYSESSCLIPLIFILPSYIEPREQIQELATTMGYTSKLTILSLGENLEDSARKSILRAQKQGEWVFLENCHLADIWVLQLEEIYETFQASNTALEFRLWLSTASSRQFPIVILQNGIKMVYDASRNFKQNLLDRYNLNPLNEPELFSSCPGHDKILSKLIYTFILFHISVEERNYFSICGWNAIYDFRHSDLTMSISQLKSVIENYDCTATKLFKPLLYLIGECNYGGKFIDYIDNKCLMTILQDFCKIDIITRENYEFCTNYSVPDRCEYRDYIKHINNLPEHPPPELFGIDQNFTIYNNTLIVNDFLLQIPRLNKWLDEDRSSSNETIGTSNIEALQNNLPLELDITKIENEYNDKDSLNGVLIQEILTYNSILESIKQSLRQTNNDVVHALEINEIPSLWYYFPKFCQHQVSLSKFIDNIKQQYDFFHKWMNGERPVSFWLGIFASAKRFISVTHMMLSRQLRIPVDQMVCSFQVLSIENPTEISSSNKKTLYLHGLLLIGASWDTNCGKLIARSPRIFSELMPIIQWTAQLSEEKTKQANYLCPLYKSNVGRDLTDFAGDLSNFIIQILLPTELPESYCIKLRTALFCKFE